MSAPISNELYYAILAMDAYNRGYDAALPGLSDAVGTKLGDATVIGSAGDGAAQADGFYAIAYELNGKKIISYRGTDDPSFFSGASDLWNGWTQGAGIISSQSEDAIRFYEDISGKSVFDKNTGVVTTGHSLGGGLAGYIGALSNGEAYIYDAMPFGAASITRVIKEQIDQANWLTGPAELTAFLTTGLSRFVLMPDADSVHYVSVSGEVLSAVRTLAWTAGSALEVAVATSLIASNLAYFPIAAVTGALAGPWAMAVGLEGTESVIDPIASSLGMVDKHSQSLLVLLQYAKDNNHTAWQTISEPLLTGWFAADNAIAKPLGLTNDQMLRQIAYSALDSGETPYGTAAIKALFDDADELGTFYALNNLSGNWGQTSVRDDLTKIITQFSGDLAVNHISNPLSVQGVFDYEAGANMISLDLRRSSWDFGASTESIVQFVSQKEALAQNLTAGFLNNNELNKVDVIISAAQKSDAMIASLFDIAPTDSALILSDGLNDKVTGTSGDDYIYAYDAGNDIVDGAGGVNTSLYKGLISDYTVTKTEAGLAVTELRSGTYQTDMLTNIQQIKFADQAAAFDPPYILGASLQKGITVGYDFTSLITKEIDGLYQICFNRLPDAEGLRYWVNNALAWGDGGSALHEISNCFFQSDEYFTTHQIQSNEEFVDQLYLDSFYRVADAEGKAYWLNDLANGLTRTDLLVSFSESAELNQIVGSRANADSGYWMV